MAIAKIALIPRAAPPTKTISLLVITASGKDATTSQSLPSILRYAQRLPPACAIPVG